MVIGTLINAQVYKAFITLVMKDPCSLAHLTANGTINNVTIYVLGSGIIVNFKYLFKSDNPNCTTFMYLVKW